MNAPKNTCDVVNFVQIFLIAQGFGDLHEGVVLHQLIHRFRVDLVVYTLLDDNKGKCYPINVWLFLTETVKTNDNVESFEFV